MWDIIVAFDRQIKDYLMEDIYPKTHHSTSGKHHLATMKWTVKGFFVSVLGAKMSDIWKSV